MTHWKQELHRAFAPPPPTGKRTFLRSRHARMPLHHVLVSQLCYIRKWVWWAAGALYLTAVIGAWAQIPETLWVISACTPMTALALVSESGRSNAYGMAELEAATRFSLRSVLLARLSLLGVFSLLLLSALVLIVPNSAGTLAAGLYISAPYLLTAFLGLCITRRLRGHEGMYACVGITFCISISVLLSHFTAAFLYQSCCIPLWGLCTAALCLGTAQQAAALIGKTEVTLWN